MRSIKKNPDMYSLIALLATAYAASLVLYFFDVLGSKKRRGFDALGFGAERAVHVHACVFLVVIQGERFYQGGEKR